MNKTDYKTILHVTITCVLAALWGGPVCAQQSTAAAPQAGQNEALQEVIVTARKRQESVLNVPVIETVVTQTQLERIQTIQISDLPTLVPGLDMGHALGSTGEQVSIRGVGTIASDGGVDSSVSLNIDGLDIANAIALESGLFDLQHVEVLKGPQALFYGKASTGGVISLRTADPTDQFEVIGTESYEVESITPREEFIISGPVTDTLKLRLAGMYSTSQGYFHETAIALPGTGAVTPTSDREPGVNQYMFRGTALWNPTGQFEARLKINATNLHGVNLESSELASCPQGPNFAPGFGIPFIAGSSCKIGRNIQDVYMDPADFPAGLPENGVPFIEIYQRFGILELNYRPIQNLTLTSATGYFYLNEHESINPTATSFAGPAIGVVDAYNRQEVTEEFRLNSEFSGPLNYTAGAFYEDGHIYDAGVIAGNTALHLPAILSDDEFYPLAIKTYSLFGQLRWKIASQLELAAGVRWTDETRSLTPYQVMAGVPVFQPIAVSRIKSDNNSPEVTLTYKPTEDQTLFAAVKQAYKSGSFSLGTVPVPGGHQSFGDEKVDGGELGWKSLLLDRHLAFDLAAYYYHYEGLQVGVNGLAVNGILQTQVENAAGASTYGIDFDADYLPEAITGLSLRAAAEWNRARYLELNNVPCWGGQTIALGCNELLNPKTGLYTGQNLSGTPMVRAPEWQLNAGPSYEFPVASGYKLVLSNNNAFTSRYATFLAVGRPNNDQYQGSFFKSDLSLSLQASDNRWELSLIGKDINDKITTGICSAANFAGAAIFGQQTTGGTTSGAAGIDQVACFVDPGRQIWLRLTVRPFGRM